MSNDPEVFILHAGMPANVFKRAGLIAEACRDAGVRYTIIDTSDCDLASLPEPKFGDAVINCGRGSVHVESMMLKPGVASVRPNGTSLVQNTGDTSVLNAAFDREGLPGPKTVYGLGPDNEALQRHVEAVGGYAAVFKATGASLGVGVFYAPDAKTGNAIADYLRAKNQHAIVREYVPCEYKTRLVVVGDEVLCGLTYPLRPNDVRSTINGTFTLADCIDPSAETIALKAAEIAEHRFCGVDIIEHPMRGPLIVELNPPFDFSGIRRIVGIDVAGPLVRYLLKRSQELMSSLSVMPARPTLAARVG